jgi:hypothetical protein
MILEYLKKFFKKKIEENIPSNIDTYLPDIIKKIDTLISNNINPYLTPYANIEIITYSKDIISSIKINKDIISRDHTIQGIYNNIDELVSDATFLYSLNTWYSNRGRYITDKNTFNVWLQTVKELVAIKHSIIIRNKEIYNLNKIDFLIRNYIEIVEILSNIKIKGK